MSPVPGQATLEDRQILQTSTDARSVKRAAVTLAKSQHDPDHQFLANHLGTSGLMARLDPPGTATGSYQHLRLARVIRGLMENSRSSAQQAILRLTDAPVFHDHFQRIQILIRALSEIRPSPPAAMVYWEKYGRPGSPVTYDVVEALCLNQSPPALALLETRFAAPEFSVREKQVWMRESILVRRYDQPLLESCERILQGAMDNPLKSCLVEVLFDYRPEEWFIECAPPKPAELDTAGDPSREVLVRIGEFALDKVDLSEQLCARVRSTVEILKVSR
jgi:hypothetical protein